MRAVWSFWSRPHALFYHRFWHGERAHLLCWALSVAEASRHAAATCLVTDNAGARLLVDQLGLPFTSVSTELEQLNRLGADPQWWVLGKLAAYAAQREPFLHLDADVILWKPLPTRLKAARVVAQNPEYFDFADQSLYRPDQFVRAIEECKGWLPGEWRRYSERRRNAALCCGILGGSDLEFFQRYARLATAIIDHPDNADAWERIGVRDNILVEQYFLAACLEADGVRADAADSADIGYLFASSRESFDTAAAADRGYTHLIGNAKADPAIAARLERRVATEHPILYKACIEAAERHRAF